MIIKEILQSPFKAINSIQFKKTIPFNLELFMSVFVILIDEQLKPWLFLQNHVAQWMQSKTDRNRYLVELFRMF